MANHSLRVQVFLRELGELCTRHQLVVGFSESEGRYFVRDLGRYTGYEESFEDVLDWSEEAMEAASDRAAEEPSSLELFRMEQMED